MLDTAIDNLDDLTVSYSGSSIVDASSANSGAGNALATFTDFCCQRTRQQSDSDRSNVAADGLLLHLTSVVHLILRMLL